MGKPALLSCFRKYILVVAFLMIYSMWVDQERVESMCTPSNLYVVTLSTVCDAILGKGTLVLARRRSTISLVSLFQYGNQDMYWIVLLLLTRFVSVNTVLWQQNLKLLFHRQTVEFGPTYIFTQIYAPGPIPCKTFVPENKRLTINYVVV